ncbi:hypothetical protein [Streptomyces sp. NPDC020817]|uniref:hypothetical protein n=1 Tax=Streptomyces sp. NPDC020817 TaxID=3365095 RepID=UPI0037907F19
MGHPAPHVLAGADGHQGAYDSWGSPGRGVPPLRRLGRGRSADRPRPPRAAPPGEQVRAAGGRFAPPAPDHAAALAGVRDDAPELWAGPRDMRAAVVAAAPGALVGHAHLPPVTAGQAAAARVVTEAAHRAARGRRPGR